MKKIIFLILLTVFSFANITKEDVRKIIKEENMLLIHYIDKRFDAIQKEMDTRFKAVDKRFESMQKQMDKRFDAVDKHFDAVDKRFNDLMNFLYILTGIFTTLTLGVIGFAYWDRRTIIKKAKEETIEEIEKEGKLKNLIKALRELSKEDKKLALILRNYGIL